MLNYGIMYRIKYKKIHDKKKRKKKEMAMAMV